MQNIAKIGARARQLSQSIKSVTEKRNDGKALEARVARLLTKEGFRKVELNTRVKDPDGNWSEIDVIGKDRSLYSRFFNFHSYIPYGARQVFVECKQYGPDHRVSLGDVSKFKEVLQLNNFPVEQGLFVTTSSYVPRATNIGVKTIDGVRLRSWARVRHESDSPILAQIGRYTRSCLLIIALLLDIGITLDIREARTKTMSPVQDISSKNEYLSFFSQYGLLGYTVTPVDTNSSYLAKMRQLCLKTTQFIVNGLSSSQESSPTSSPNSKPSIIKPEDRRVYIAYEFHQPLPINPNAREEVLSKIGSAALASPSRCPDILRTTWARTTAGSDYFLLKYLPSNKPAKFFLSRLCNEYCVVDQGGYTVLKIPIPHFLSAPGYFSSYALFRARQLHLAANNTIQQVLPPSSPSSPASFSSSSPQTSNFVSSTIEPALNASIQALETVQSGANDVWQAASNTSISKLASALPTTVSSPLNTNQNLDDSDDDNDSLSSMFFSSYTNDDGDDGDDDNQEKSPVPITFPAPKWN